MALCPLCNRVLRPYCPNCDEKRVFNESFLAEELVRKALGHRLELELEPIPRIRVSGRTISAIANDEPLDELWMEAYQYIVDLGPEAYGVTVQ